MNTLVLRVIGAALVLAVGAIHLQLYFDSYRHVPQANVGRSFILNAVAALVVAIAIVVWRHWLPLVAGIVLLDATLFAFALSRTSVGIFGFTEQGWNPSPQAALAVACEVAAAVVLVVTLALEWRPARRLAAA
jgi:hypothetical protein